MKNVKFTPEQIKFLEEHSSVVPLPDGTEYFYIPFWFKKSADNDVFEKYQFHEIPMELVSELNKERHMEDKETKTKEE